MSTIRYIRCRAKNGEIIRVKLIYGSKLARWLLPGFRAITIWNRIYIRGREPLSEAIIKHELCHVKQWYSMGPAKFFWCYLVESITNGYRMNRLEVEAREAETAVKK